MKPTWQHPQLNQQDPSEGRRPLVEHDLLVHLGRALKRETKAKGFEQYSGNSAKQMKTSLNFWKGFIIPTDIIVMQTLRPLKISEWQMWPFGAKCLRYQKKVIKIRWNIWNEHFLIGRCCFFKLFDREKQKKDAKWNITFLAEALDSQKVSNWMRGKSPLGKEWCAYCKEEELWKTETALGWKRRTTAKDESLLCGREGHSEWRGPRVLLDLRHWINTEEPAPPRTEKETSLKYRNCKKSQVTW